ncbi:hypothetical protein B0J15DRAFT_552474 [Fusarium solani]|uniref:Uncharacterized protein n=1 Tax=Fusarium solani TaxID=169388 RepID=A0A9P9K5L8_FUSSL|nr:uncharacterized protein B0J15DRAFT_552474 [Fusarium solani]KAH7244860.1 hypothetical protein B0J15DRAFT_552474 [Fusarium solani]
MALVERRQDARHPNVRYGREQTAVAYREALAECPVPQRSRDNRELVRSIVEEHFNSLPMGIKFYFYQRGETGEADIRIKFSNKSRCYAGTAAKSVRRSSKPTMKLGLETPKRFNGQDRRLCFKTSSCTSSDMPLAFSTSISIRIAGRSGT